jgi:hypothetical protein
MMREKMLEMAEMQSRLNNYTNGEDWRTGVTNKGKTINWHTAISLEGAELIDSTPWKHWKAITGEADINNIHIEAVDLYHFIQSEALITLTEIELSNLINDIFIDNMQTVEFDFQKVNIYTKKLMYYSLEADCIADKEYNLTAALEAFSNIMKYSGLNFELLYKLYIFKNALNIFRQDNGYKEGTYSKDWNGKEDNVVLKEIKDNMEVVTFEALYSELEEAYKLVK